MLIYCMHARYQTKSGIHTQPFEMHCFDAVYSSLQIKLSHHHAINVLLLSTPTWIELLHVHNVPPALPL
jgi:hypothetical protein